MDILERVEAEGIAVVWNYDPRAPLAVYTDDPPELTLGHYRWQATPARERERATCHELAHRKLGVLYRWSDAPEDQATIRWLEAKVEREALADFIPEAAIWEAYGQGCETVEQLAAVLGVPVPVAAARLRLLSPWH